MPGNGIAAVVISGLLHSISFVPCRCLHSDFILFLHLFHVCFPLKFVLRLMCTEYIVLTSGLHNTSARSVAGLYIDLRTVTVAPHWVWYAVTVTAGFPPSLFIYREPQLYRQLQNCPSFEWLLQVILTTELSWPGLGYKPH